MERGDVTGRRQQEREERLSPAKRALLARLRAGRSLPAEAAGAGPGASGSGDEDSNAALPVPLRSVTQPGATQPGATQPGATGRRPPLVLVHPVGGALFCYARLVAGLTPGVPVLGFAADGVDPGVPDRQLLPALAARYLRGLSAAGFEPACVLAGWSMGGLVAYEMARQTAAATGRYNPVVLIDAANIQAGVTWDEPKVCAVFVRDLGRLAGADPARLPDPDRPPSDPQVDPGDLLAATGIDLGLSQAELDRRFRVFRLNLRAMFGYRPGSYPGPVVLLNATGSPDLEPDWRPLVGTPIRRHAVPGDHYQLFDPGSVELVARVLDQVVQAAAHPPRPRTG